MKRFGRLGVYDTGAPPVQGSNDYTTLVVLHGFAYHSGMLAIRAVCSNPMNDARSLRLFPQA